MRILDIYLGLIVDILGAMKYLGSMSASCWCLTDKTDLCEEKGGLKWVIKQSQYCPWTPMRIGFKFVFLRPGFNTGHTGRL